MEKFRRLDPPVFKGEGKPNKVEGWIREMEKIFRVIQCSEEDKVNLASYMLQDQADDWWQTTGRMVFQGRQQLPWDDFLVELRKMMRDNAPLS